MSFTISISALNMYRVICAGDTTDMDDVCRRGDAEALEMMLQIWGVEDFDLSECGSAFRCAAGNGHMECVALLLDDGRVDPMVCSGDALLWALENGHLRVAERMLCDNRVTTYFDINPHYIDDILDACWMNQQIAELLLPHVMVMRLSSYFIFDVFDWAVRSGANDLVDEMLLHNDSEMAPRLAQYALSDREPDIDALEENDEASNVALIESLLFHREAGYDPADDESRVLRVACHENYPTVVRCLLHDGRVDASANQNICIQECSARGYTCNVQQLLRIRAVDPSTNDSMALRLACLNDHADIVHMLLTDIHRPPHQRADPTVLNSECLTCASASGHIDVVRLLLSDPRVSVSANDNEAIVAAVTNKHIDVVERLLVEPDVNAATRSNLCIRQACEDGNVALARVLLNVEDVDPSDNGNQAMLYACETNDVDIMTLLLSDPLHRVDPGDRNSEVLCIAALENKLNILQLLVADSRVDVCCQSHYAVRWACLHENLSMLSCLLHSKRVPLTPHLLGVIGMRAPPMLTNALVPLLSVLPVRALAAHVFSVEEFDDELDEGMYEELDVNDAEALRLCVQQYRLGIVDVLEWMCEPATAQQYRRHQHLSPQRRHARHRCLVPRDVVDIVCEYVTNAPLREMRVGVCRDDEYSDDGNSSADDNGDDDYGSNADVGQKRKRP